MLSAFLLAPEEIPELRCLFFSYLLSLDFGIDLRDRRGVKKIISFLDSDHDGDDDDNDDDQSQD